MKQTPERWRRVKEAVGAALEVAPEERLTLLEQLLEDPTLVADAEGYLGLEAEMGSFIENPAVSLSPRDARDPMVGQRIGPYKLERLLGRGGMGAVYLAVREDDYEKRVALKLIHQAMSTAEMVERFRKERQILADLEHPHIARLLDGGTTGEGLPYFVMEYVEGQPIDRYCDDRHLSIRRRLVLFRQICSAVHFAHRNLVVHRDLKPGNILVDASGVAKLLDFGIAKLLGTEPVTRLLDPGSHDPGAGPMTYQYASPEQILGEPITTASDVYSLGVLLYELLSGHLPFRRERYRHPLAVVKVMGAAEPQKPSTAIYREEQRGGADSPAGRITPESVSATREGDPTKLHRQLSGDVDAMVAKALRREPEHRYGSAGELSDDIRRYLEGHPVEARAGSFTYRAVKLMRRNRVALATAAGFLTMAIGFVITLAVQLERTKSERNRATMAMDLLVELLESPEVSAGESLDVEDVIQRGVDLFDEGFAEDLEAQANTLNSLALLYSFRGSYDKARELYESALEKRRAMWKGNHPLVAESLHNLAHVLALKGEFARAELLSREALAIQRRHYDKPHRLLAKGITGHATHLYELEKYDEAEALYLEALKMKTRLYGEVHLDVATGHANLGTLFYDRGDYESARHHYEKALEIRERLLPANHQKLGKSYSHMGRVLIAMEEYEEAVAVFRRVLEIRTVIHGPGHPEVAHAQNALAFSLQRIGEVTEAEELYRRALAVRIENFTETHSSVATVKRNLASLLVERGEYPSAEALAREALEVFSEREGNWRVADTRSVLGAALAGQGLDTDAERILRESLTALEEQRGESSLYTREARDRLREFLESRESSDGQG